MKLAARWSRAQALRIEATMHRTLFADIGTDRCQGEYCEVCTCSTKQRIVRSSCAGRWPKPLTPAEPENLVDGASHAGEGYYNSAELEAMTGAALAGTTLNAWSAYTQIMC